MWEEPPISGEAGSGTIFFSGCPLKCVYCQNHEISTGNFGIEVPPERLVEIMLELQDQGALNINLVTATHYAHLLPYAVAEARARGLSIPSFTTRVVTSAWTRYANSTASWTSGSPTSSTQMSGSPARCRTFPIIPSRRPRALAQMKRQIDARGGIAFDEAGIMRRGIIVRHLVLPGHADDSCRVLRMIWETAGDVPISVMNQYTPNAACVRRAGSLRAQ